MDAEHIAQAVHPVPGHERRVLPCAKERVIVEQKDAILGPFDDRLDQHRVVILRHLVEIANQRGLAVHRLREIAALQERYEPTAVRVNTTRIRPRKSDIAVGAVGIAWVPWMTGPDGMPEPAF